MDRDRYEALLNVSRAIAGARDLKSLFHDLARLLEGVVSFDFLNLILYDAAAGEMRLHVLETRVRANVPPATGLPAEETPAGWVWLNQAPMVVSDVGRETRWGKVMDILRNLGVCSCCWVPLTTAQRRLGALGFGRLELHPYSKPEVDFMGLAAAQVAVAVDNSLRYEEAQRYERELAHERDRLRAVLDITNLVVSNLDIQEIFRAIAASLRSTIPHDYASIALFDEQYGALRLRALDFPQGGGTIEEEMLIPLEGSPGGLAYRTGKPVVITPENIGSFSSELVRRLEAAGLRNGCSAPLVTAKGVLGVLNVVWAGDRPVSDDDVSLLSQVAVQIAIAIENALAYRQIQALKDRLAEEKLYLEEEIQTEHNFGEIVGESPAFQAALRKTETVAATNAAVLILGETGTGKELVARAIHDLSPRRSRTFVKVNCAAIPTGLLESELFGHEKGAFTGAIARKLGRFELADQGTLFLDEVGDIPLELQPKLLRALQEQEFERLGSNQTIRVDVRVVAATNRDLIRMVGDREFRSDLFYRLNVFPIQIPPLRERREDIPLLVRYFAQKYSRQMDRHILSIPTEAMEAMSAYSWPGNIRELENFIERAVILSPGPGLRIPIAELRDAAGAAQAYDATLEEAEREHILRVLRETRWRLSGEGGAAERLGMKRTTLQSKMKKLGIERPV